MGSIGTAPLSNLLYFGQIIHIEPCELYQIYYEQISWRRNLKQFAH